ncbi:MAG: TIR domain-containing protein [Xanthomonadales bacterium]|nr:TIR domain-containing protein [Xanthomonadales bacterium]
MARKCFYSFHFRPDCWRASTVRRIGTIEGNEPTTDNAWEAISSGVDKNAKIRRWIAGQLSGRTCTVVLVGAETANRKWINHEIVESWNAGIGLVGIHIHGLKNNLQQTSAMGANPFGFITHNPTRSKLSSIVKCYNPTGATSQERYDWISKHLADAVEEAIAIRKKYWTNAMRPFGSALSKASC